MSETINTGFKFLNNGKTEDIFSYLLTKDIFDDAVTQNPGLLKLKWNSTSFSAGGTLKTLTDGKFDTKELTTKTFLRSYNNFGGWTRTKTTSVMDNFYKGITEIDPKAVPIPFNYTSDNCIWPLQSFIDSSTYNPMYIKWASINDQEGVWASSTENFLSASSTFITSANGIFVMLQGAGGGATGAFAWCNKTTTTPNYNNVEYGVKGGAGGGSGAFGLVYLDIKSLSEKHIILKIESGEGGAGVSSPYNTGDSIHQQDHEKNYRPDLSNAYDGSDTKIWYQKYSEGWNAVCQAEGGGGAKFNKNSKDIGGYGGSFTLYDFEDVVDDVFVVCEASGAAGGNGNNCTNYVTVPPDTQPATKQFMSTANNGYNIILTGDSTDIFEDRIIYRRNTEYPSTVQGYVQTGTGSNVSWWYNQNNHYTLASQGGGGGGPICGCFYNEHFDPSTDYKNINPTLGGYGHGGIGACICTSWKKERIGLDTQDYHAFDINYINNGGQGGEGGFAICKSWTYNEDSPEPPEEKYLVNVSVTNGTWAGVTEVARNGHTAITITPESGYLLPETVDVSGDCNYIYEGNAIIISNVRSDIALTATCTPMSITYSINTTITNGTYSGDTTVSHNGRANITIIPNANHQLPTQVNVVGTCNYDYQNGTIMLTNVQSDVGITATCPSTTTYSITYNENEKWFVEPYHKPTSVAAGGTSEQINIDANEGWAIVSVSVTNADKVDEHTYGPSMYEFKVANPTGPVTIDVTCIEN